MPTDLKGYSTDPELEWYYPQDYTPPKGVKVFLLTKGGVAVTGVWKDNAGFIGWRPLFKRNLEKEQT